MSPIFHGMRSLKRSHCSRPRSVLLPLLEAGDDADDDARSRGTSLPVMRFDSATVNFVMAGSSPPKSLKIFSKTGTRKTTSAMQHDEREAADQRRVHHRRLDLAAQRVVLLELVGDALERLLEDAAGLAGRDHRDVEVVEDLRGGARARRRTRCRPRRPCGRRVSASRNLSFSTCSSSTYSARSSDMPDEIIVESWRVATVSSCALTRLKRLKKSPTSAVLFCSSMSRTIRPLRAQLRGDRCLFSASTSPRVGRPGGRAP